MLVYLPTGYRRSPRRRYPVLYLHDGQNVFDAATSFGGVEWGADESAAAPNEQRLIEPLIIVAVANTGEHRIHEYAPTRGVIDASGEAQETQPRRAAQIRAVFDRRAEAIHRSRIPDEAGGRVYRPRRLVVRRTRHARAWAFVSQTFHRLAVMSPSIWWDDCAIYRIVDELTEKPPLKIWLDTGTNEPGWERGQVLRDRLVGKGWRLYDDLQYTEVEGADHSEGAWGARFEAVLRFLYPPAPPGTKEPLPTPPMLEAIR